MRFHRFAPAALLAGSLVLWHFPWVPNHSGLGIVIDLIQHGTWDQEPYAEAGGLGLFLADGVRLTNVEADFSVRPDAVFVSHSAQEARRVRVVEGMEEGFLELEGSPDMVLEVVSPSSVRKDTVLLRKSYWEAGIGEYWLVDARKDAPTFDILRLTAKGYAAARKQDGWMRSGVFGKSFRLTRRTDALGQPDFVVEMR